MHGVPSALILAVTIGWGGLCAGEEASLEDLEGAESQLREEIVHELEFVSLVAMQAGDLERAAWAQRKLFRLDESSLPRGLELADVLMRAGHTDEATRVLGQLVGLTENEARVLYLQAEVARMVGDEEERRSLCERARRVVAVRDSGLEVAEFFDRMGRPEIASLVLEELADGHDETALKAVLEIADGEWIMGDYDAALARYQRAQRLLRGVSDGTARPATDVISRRAAFCEALQQLRDGDSAEAALEMRMLVSDGVVGIEAGIELVRYQRERGRDDLSQEIIRIKVGELEDLIEQEGGMPAVQNMLAWFMAQVDHDLERAKALSEISLRGEPTTPAFRDTLAEIHYRMGQRTMAVEEERLALALRPKHRSYYERQLRKFESD